MKKVLWTPLKALPGLLIGMVTAQLVIDGRYFDALSFFVGAPLFLFVALVFWEHHKEYKKEEANLIAIRDALLAKQAKNPCPICGAPCHRVCLHCGEHLDGQYADLCSCHGGFFYQCSRHGRGHGL